MVRGTLTLVSGGQTGVDRAALEVGVALGVPVSGWVPAGRMAEDGPIPSHFAGLCETATADPAERTRLNVEESDALVVITRGPTRGGTRLALEVARGLGRPVLVLDLAEVGEREAARALRGWLAERAFVRRLNVAGPRESEVPGIGMAARRVLGPAMGYFCT